MKENAPNPKSENPGEGVLDVLYKKIMQSYEEWNLRELSGSKQSQVPLVYTPFFKTIHWCKDKPQQYAGKVQKYTTDNKTGKTHKIGSSRQRRDYYSNKRQRNHYNSNSDWSGNSHHNNRRDRFGRSIGSNVSWGARERNYHTGENRNRTGYSNGGHKQNNEPWTMYGT